MVVHSGDRTQLRLTSHVPPSVSFQEQCNLFDKRLRHVRQITLLYDVKGKRIEYSGQHFALLTAFGKI